MPALSRVAILHQGFIPTYRERFYELLNAQSRNEYVVFHGEPPRGSGHVALPGPFNFPNVRVNNREIGIGGRAAIYQPVVRQILTGGFDAVVVGHEIKFLASMLLFAMFKARGKAAVLWGHGYHRPDAAALARRSSLVLARAADGYLAYSEGGAKLLRLGGLPAERIVVVRNTIDIAQEIAAHGRVAGTDRAVLKAELGLRPDAQTLLFIGRLYGRKRVGDLLDLVRRLNGDASVGAVDLLIAGDGPDRASLEAQAADLPNVRFLGNVYDPNEVGKLMRVSVASMMPGSVGLSVNHSFAHGLPVITRPNALDSPEIDYVRDGENGLIVPGNFDAFVAAVAAFLRDKALQERLAAAALATRKTLGLDHMVAQFDRGVCQAIDRCRRPPVDRRAESVDLRPANTE